MEPTARPSQPPDGTHWTRILAGDRDYLVERYRRPIFRWFRSRLPSDEIAEDVTQDFFVRLLEKDILGTADPARGRFRSLLYQVARRFLADVHRERLAAKRGGQHQMVELQPELVTGSDDARPDAEFDRHWFFSLISRARRAVKEHAEKAGKPEYYQAFRLYYFDDGPDGRHPIARIAQEMGATVREVDNYLRRARQAYARAVRDLVAEYSTDIADYEEEMRDLTRVIQDGELGDLPPADREEPDLPA